MTDKKLSDSKKRKKYSAQFKEQVLERAQREGISKTAKDLGLHEAMIYSWRTNKAKTGIPFEDRKLEIAELARLKREVSRLSEENAFLKKVSAYFAKDPK